MSSSETDDVDLSPEADSDFDPPYLPPNEQQSDREGSISLTFGRTKHAKKCDKDQTFK